MELNLFKNNNKNDDSNNIVENFINELTNFLNKNSQSVDKSHIETKNISTESDFSSDKTTQDILESHNDNAQNIDNTQKLNENHKEGHLYFVTSDRNNQIYLWDFTDKPEYEFEEKNIPPELQDVAKEGAMLKFENGTFVLYSEEGYDMLFDEDR